MPIDTIQTISMTLGAAWASGINLYAAVLTLGFLAASGQMTLPPDLAFLSNPLVMFAAGLMYTVEFFADKTPGVDTGWDVLHTFIRIPAGAALAAGMAQGLDIGQSAEFAAMLVGGGLAATSHATKAGTRVMINTSPEPMSNWTASISEDIAVIGGLWAALHYPWLFVAGLVVFLLLVAWLLPKLWRALKRLTQTARRFFSGRRGNSDPSNPASKGAGDDILRALHHQASEKND